MEAVEFDLDGRRFALPMSRVIELAPTVRCRRLPGAPAAVEGMVNHAGSPIPLVSMRRVFGLEPQKEENLWNDHLIVARGATRTFALRVDRAIGLVYLDDDAIRSGVPSRHVRGVAVLPDNDLLYIQDLDALLSLSEETKRELAQAIEAAV